MPKITENIFFIPGQDEFFPDSNVFVIGEKDSHDLTLVDAGLMGKGSYKIKSILSEGYKLEDIKRIIATHVHVDHIGCLPELHNEIPGMELWVQKEEAVPLEEGDERDVYALEAFQEMCQRQYNLKPGYFTSHVDCKLTGGEKLEIGGMTWEVLHIPGHSAGSVALYEPVQKVLIPGDVVYADYGIGRFDVHRSSGSALKQSLQLLAELDVKILLPGHNRIIKDVKPGYIRNTLKQWEYYLM